MGTHGKTRARESARKLRIDKQRRALKRAQIVKSIRKWDDPILKQVTEPVEENEISTGIAQGWADEMIKTLKATKDGVGLAAPQIGLSKSILVYQTKDAGGKIVYEIMVNPLVVEYGKVQVTSREACLSYPGYEARVQRYDAIKVNWKSATGKDKEGWLNGRDAIIFQHENDHLSGICKVGEEWEKAVGLRPKDTDEITSDAFFEDVNVGAEIPAA